MILARTIKQQVHTRYQIELNIQYLTATDHRECCHVTAFIACSGAKKRCLYHIHRAAKRRLPTTPPITQFAIELASTSSAYRTESSRTRIFDTSARVADEQLSLNPTNRD